jgi:hypothetical protein
MRLPWVFGDRYLPAGQFFGNINYKGGPIEIADIRGGIQLIQTIPAENVLLMCMCANYRQCHRKVIAEHLQELGFTYYELSAYKEIMNQLVVPDSEQMTF